MDPIVMIIFTIKGIINIINVSIDQNLKLGNCRLIDSWQCYGLFYIIYCLQDEQWRRWLFRWKNHHHRKRGNEFGSVLLLSVGISISEQDWWCSITANVCMIIADSDNDEEDSPAYCCCRHWELFSLLEYYETQNRVPEGEYKEQ